MAPQPSPYDPYAPQPYNNPWLQQGMMELLVPPVQQPGFYPYVYGPEDEDEIDTLDYQNDVLNAWNKAGRATMDPAFLLSLGNSTGAPGPEAYDPVPQYQTFDPTFVLMDRTFRNGDILQQTIARLSDEGLTGSGAIARAIMDAVNDPQSPEDEALAMAIPQYTDEMNQTQLDQNYVMDQAEAYSRAKMMQDPRASQWDGETLDESGMPAIVSYRPSEMTQALERAGISSTPYDTYNPDIFAAEGIDPAMQRALIERQMTGQAEAQQIGKVNGLKQQVDEQMRRLAEATSTSNRTQELNMVSNRFSRPEAQESPRSQRPSRNPVVEARRLAGPTQAPPSPVGGRPSRNPNVRQRQEARQQQVDPVAASLLANRNETGQQFANRMVPVLREQQNLSMMRNQMYDQAKKFNQATGTADDQVKAAYARQMEEWRRRQAQNAYNAGFSPFNDQMQARMQAVWGR